MLHFFTLKDTFPTYQKFEYCNVEIFDNLSVAIWNYHILDFRLFYEFCDEFLKSNFDVINETN